MTSLQRIALAQINPRVGDLPGNRALIEARIGEAKQAGAQLVVFPELAICGYPPEDLLLRQDFLDACAAELEDLARGVEGIVVCLGAPVQDQRDTYNALCLLADGELKAVYRKCALPNYGVFDEKRVFAAGEQAAVIELGQALVGLSVCEDIWIPDGPHVACANAGAQLLINISASPYHRGKLAQRERMISQRAADCTAWIAYCNQVGGQDELVFDGGSMVCDQSGRVVARAAQFAEQLLLVELELDEVPAARRHDPRSRGTHSTAAALGRIALDQVSGAAPAAAIAPMMGRSEEMYQALVTGVSDYLGKSGFRQAIVGLSGGIDSALVALIAADALGAENLTCVVMPSPHSSAETQEDARELARRLGASLVELPIGELMQGYERTLAAEFAGLPRGVTEENIQARIRGNLLMALSNKLGALVLSTGNKSEMAVGYATLYGDMAGGFAVLKDLPKLDVYALTEWRGRELVPAGIIERPPSAELAPGQQDTDSLPPYEVLDPIIEAYVERDLSIDEITARGFDRSTVERVAALVDRAEFKRRQAAPGIRLSVRAFGRDRRVPIINAFAPQRAGSARQAQP